MLQIQRILLFLSIFALSQVQTQEQTNKNSKKLSVLVLYESLCPDSRDFIINQLGPSYDDLKNYIDVQLVPFGKSHSQDSGAKFFCQHGPDECAGNRIQSCVLSQTIDQGSQIKFAVCAMSQPVEYYKSCAESVGLSSDIDQCMNTPHGTELQLRAEKITKSFLRNFVPTIIFESTYNQELQDLSLRNFRGAVCTELQRMGTIGFSDPPCV